MKKSQIKEYLKDGKKVATKEMMKNGDYLVKAENSNTVIRSWGGNENILGDRYCNLELDKNEQWYIVE